MFPAGRVWRRSVGSREVGQLSAEACTTRWYPSCRLRDSSARDRRPRGTHLRVRRAVGGTGVRVKSWPDVKWGWGDGKDGAGLLDCQGKTTVSRGEINNKLGQIHPYKSGSSRCCPRYPFFFAAPKTPGSLSPVLPDTSSHVWHPQSGIFITALAFARELSGFRKLVKITILPRDVWREAFSEFWWSIERTRHRGSSGITWILFGSFTI